MEDKTYSDSDTMTVGEALDRLEVPAGKIGLNSRRQAVDLLKGLDRIYARLQELNPDSQSRKVAETQFESIVAKIKSEAARFVRDVGGADALKRERQEVNPPGDHEWWYLDELVLQRRQQSLRRWLIIGGAAVAILAVLAVVYNIFLAPDPKVAAVYSAQSTAQDRLISGDFQAALQEAEVGLKADPTDATLLVTKGVALENLGKPDQAAESFSAAQQYVARPDDFYYLRGQAYAMAQQVDKALADAQKAAEINPKSAPAHLLAGQIYESTQQNELALDEYEKAFKIAGENKQTELEAMARMRTAMLLQSMNAQMPTPAATLTPTK